PLGSRIQILPIGRLHLQQSQRRCADVGAVLGDGRPQRQPGDFLNKGRLPVKQGSERRLPAVVRQRRSRKGGRTGWIHSVRLPCPLIGGKELQLILHNRSAKRHPILVLP